MCDWSLRFNPSQQVILVGESKTRHMVKRLLAIVRRVVKPQPHCSTNKKDQVWLMPGGSESCLRTLARRHVKESTIEKLVHLFVLQGKNCIWGRGNLEQFNLPLFLCFQGSLRMVVLFMDGGPQGFTLALLKWPKESGLFVVVGRIVCLRSNEIYA